MAVSEAHRRTSIAAAAALLPGAQVRGYVVGRTGPHPLLIGWGVVAGIVAVTVAMVAMVGQVVFPGLIAFGVLHHVLSPPVGLVVADQGVALVKRSGFNGKPHLVTSVTGHAQVQPMASTAGRVKVVVGDAEVWLVRAEEERLRNLMTWASVPPPGLLPMA